MGLISVSRPLRGPGGDAPVPVPYVLPDGEVYDQHVNDDAAIQQSKIAISISEADLDDNISIPKEKLDDLKIEDADIVHNASIAQTKIDLLITNADIATNAEIDTHKIADIYNDDIAHNANISTSKLDLTDSNLVSGSQSSLLIIGGTIMTTSWSPESGEGFGWSPDGTGKGKITFYPTVFDGVPSVTLTAINPVGVSDYEPPRLMVDGPTLTGATCNITGRDVAGSLVDAKFSFIALGRKL